MRYALYYIPEEQSPLAMLGASLLGWNIHTAVPSCAEAILCGFEKAGLRLSQDKLESITQEARRYGLHATLKAPFHLADGYGEEQLIQAVDAFSAEQKAFSLPPMQVSRIGDFLALTLRADTPQELDDKQKTYAFAAQCLRHFEEFRHPPSAEELARRRQKKLSLRQEDYLLCFGYPYVLEDFRFHITLCHVPSCHSSEDESWNVSLQNALSHVFSSCLQGNKMSSLCLCCSDAAGRFSLLHKAPLST